MRNALLFIGVLGLAVGLGAQEAAISFDVTSVKLNNGGGKAQSIFPLGPGDAYVSNGGRFNASGLPLVTYLAFAYKISGNDAAGVLAQMPGWATTARYDIEARTDGDPKKDTKDQMRLMMRALLADRFRMKIHYETREVSVLAAGLVKAGKTGPQLQAHSQSETESPCTTVLAPGTTQLGAGTVTGGYPKQCGGLLMLPPSAPGRARVGARNITMDFLAVKDQLGLKLDSRKGSTEVLIIDHVERPSAN